MCSCRGFLSYTQAEAETAIVSAATWQDALAALGVRYHGKSIATLRKWAARWSISTDHLTDQRGRRRIRSRYTEEEAREAISTSRSWAEALRKLGMCHSGGNWKLLRDRAQAWGISADHFDPYARGREVAKQRRRALDEILVENSTYSRFALKERLYAEGLKKRRCELCGQDEMWKGQAMTLILDHINGIRNDNRLENLRIVCPNCAATLETHCGRKNRLDISERNCVHCSKSFRPNRMDQRYCSPACGSRSAGPRGPRPERRRCERPPLEQLLREIDELGYLATGRKYGVSDNAIRKWVRVMLSEQSSDADGQMTLAIPTRTWPNRRR
ncbi:MAG: HNH endonuclease [Actinomycetota bacterium]|nr:HNH endonuclease [Actinomycetota bacterium]